MDNLKLEFNPLFKMNITLIFLSYSKDNGEIIREMRIDNYSSKE